MEDHSLEGRLSNLVNGFGPFTPQPESDQARLASNMLTEISEIEKLVHDESSSRIEYELGIAFRNYCAWYAHGDNKAEYLSKALSHFLNALRLGENVDAKVETTRILIEEAPVRDLETAIRFANELKKAGQLPDWMASIVEKAKRWSGKADTPKDNDFSDLNAAPAALREERTKLRKLLVDAMKAKDTASAASLAARLYNLGLLAAYLYGSWDASSGVTGSDFDSAEKKLRKVKLKFNFGYLGRIMDAGFLTPTDYSRIEKVLGSTPKTITTGAIKLML